MTDFNVEFFNILPAELREYIISQRSELLLPFSQTSKEYQEMLSHQICELPITIDEFESNSSKSRISGILTTSVDHPYGATFILEISVKKLQYCEEITISTIVLTPEGKIVLATDVDYNKLVGVGSYLDLLIDYNIMNNRLNCVRLNPKFANNYILNDLNLIRNKYDNAMLKNIIDYDYLYVLIYTYMFLLMNTYVFNIYSSIDPEDLVNLPNNLIEIKKDIQFMFDKIEKAINCL